MEGLSQEVSDTTSVSEAADILFRLRGGGDNADGNGSLDEAVDCEVSSGGTSAGEGGGSAGGGSEESLACGEDTLPTASVVVKSEWMELSFRESASTTFVDLFSKCARMLGKEVDTVLFSLSGVEFYPLSRVHPSVAISAYALFGYRLTIDIVECVTIHVHDLASYGKVYTFILWQRQQLWDILKKMRSLHFGSARVSILIDDRGRFVHANGTPESLSFGQTQSLYYWHSPIPTSPLLSLWLNNVGVTEGEDGLRLWNTYDEVDSLNYVVSDEDAFG